MAKRKNPYVGTANDFTLSIGYFSYPTSIFGWGQPGKRKVLAPTKLEKENFQRFLLSTPRCSPPKAVRLIVRKAKRGSWEYWRMREMGY